VKTTLLRILGGLMIALVVAVGALLLELPAMLRGF
jgi:hypothetical protein